MQRKLIGALASATLAGMLFLGGCAPSNESTANIEGEPAKGVDGAPPPQTQEEYMKQMGQAGGNNPYAGQGYPGRN